MLTLKKQTPPRGNEENESDPISISVSYLVFVSAQTLLREVHQEGMQVLSLSELPVSEGEPGSQFHVPGWAKEREALLANVESLKSLISQMQIHKETQVEEKKLTTTSFIKMHASLELSVFVCVFTCLYLFYLLQTSGTVDWRGELLDAVRLVFVKERSVLKSALYSQLELMDTSDAIIQLNQLEHRLAEQVNNKH